MLQRLRIYESLVEISILEKESKEQTVEAPMKKAAASVKEVTVIATPACFIA